VKTKTWTVGIAVLSLFAAPAYAQTISSDWSYDSNVEKVAFAGDCCDTCGCGDGWPDALRFLPIARYVIVSAQQERLTPPREVI